MQQLAFPGAILKLQAVVSNFSIGNDEAEFFIVCYIHDKF